MNVKTILVPVDFSDVSTRVCDAATALASAFGARLILLHVQEPDVAFAGFEPVPVVPTVRPENGARRRQLDDLRVRLAEAGIDVTAVYVEGTVTQNIRAQADAHHAELIVIGSHGHGALYNLLAGSVASAVLKEARCPVLVVPAGRSVRSRG